MAMTPTYITYEETQDPESPHFGEQKSEYSQINVPSWLVRKGQNDEAGVQTRGYGHWRNDEGVIENLNYAAMSNKPENLWIGVGYDEFAMGYHSLESAQELATRPNWQSSETPE